MKIRAWKGGRSVRIYARMTKEAKAKLLARVKAEGCKSLGDWLEAQAHKRARALGVCPECDGTGDNPDGDSVSTDCPACGGSGKC